MLLIQSAPEQLFTPNHKFKNQLALLNLINDANKKTAHRGTAETIILNLLDSLTIATASLLDNLDTHHETAIAIWRTQYESAVILRNFIQTLVINHDPKLFAQLCDRYADYQVISAMQVFKDDNYQLLNQVKRKYYHVSPELTLQYDYDWAKPLFTTKQLKKCYQPYRLGFRDLVYKGNLIDQRLTNLLDYYSLASNMVHVTPISAEVSHSITDYQLKNITNTVLNCALSDYVELLLALYQPVKMTSVTKKLLSTLTTWHNNLPKLS